MLAEKWWKLYKVIDSKYSEQFGFRMKDTSFRNVVEYLHKPKDSSSLAVTRILFGVAMLFDIPDERGGASMEQRWNAKLCHFPLIPFIQAIAMPYMALVYAALWLGALGIALGYKYRLSSIIFVTCYWYLFLIEKSYWNNHSYLFGLVGLLLACTDANCYWSIDAYLDPSKKKSTVPYWNYFILKYQFFILYFMAGLKKGTAEWLTGYSVQKLSEHWVFDPFKFFLTVPEIDLLIVHWFIFGFDLTVAMWMMWSRTRSVAMVLCAMFHLMNSRLFRIGMFPWVCLATMPLFYPFDWPKNIIQCIEKIYNNVNNIKDRLYVYLMNCYKYEKKEVENGTHIAAESYDADDEEGDTSQLQTNEDDIKQESSTITKNESTSDVDKHDEKTNTDNETDPKETTDYVEQEEPINYESKRSIDKKSLTTFLILFHVITQLFLPYSHFITKGYNNWTNGLYGYSWDMMVHTWDTQSIIVKIVDNDNKDELYIDPSVYTLNDRWSRHGDMVYQYTHCIKDKLLKDMNTFETPISENLSIYVDVWSAMNGRFTQRLFDPKVDMLKASWSPFKKVSYLMPLLDDAIHWRRTLAEITEEVRSQSNGSDVLFLADFPGYEQEKYVPPEMRNVTLTVLEGVITFEPEASDLKGFCYHLIEGESTYVDSGLFHRTYVAGEKPAYYMYTFTNSSATNATEDAKIKPKLPIFNELYIRFKGMYIFVSIIIRNSFLILFGCDGMC